MAKCRLWERYGAHTHFHMHIHIPIYLYLSLSISIYRYLSLFIAIYRNIGIYLCPPIYVRLSTYSHLRIDDSTWLHPSLRCHVRWSSRPWSVKPGPSKQLATQCWDEYIESLSIKMHQTENANINLIQFLSNLLLWFLGFQILLHRLSANQHLNQGLSSASSVAGRYLLGASLLRLWHDITPVSGSSKDLLPHGWNLLIAGFTDNGLSRIQNGPIMSNVRFLSVDQF